uniref:Uncharacterized protein n=1 Tax=uncultured prokaryote TaxID=198431 RepID=A0A0H5Q789_9ZZZZ|nr:hypothetical protein [uncultured prokaryote]
MIPTINVQTSFVRPVPLRLELSILWHPRSDHSIVRTTLNEGVDGDLLGLGVGSAPPWSSPVHLAEALTDHLVVSVDRIYAELVNPDPF